MQGKKRKKNYEHIKRLELVKLHNKSKRKLKKIDKSIMY